jgi:hypothetical protein
LLKQFHTDRAPKGISGSQMQAFRGKKGPDAGNTSSVFYGAYVFFEKMRIKQNKPKSEKRKEMEEVWGPGGFDIEHNSATTGLVLSFFFPLLFLSLLSVSPALCFLCLFDLILHLHYKGSFAKWVTLSQKTNSERCTPTSLMRWLHKHVWTIKKELC